MDILDAFAGEPHRHINFRLMDPELSSLIIPDLLPPLDAARKRDSREDEGCYGKAFTNPLFREAMREAAVHGRSQPKQMIVDGIKINFAVEIEMTPIEVCDDPIIVVES